MNAETAVAEVKAVIGYHERMIGPKNVERLKWWVDQLIAAERRRAVSLLRKEWNTLSDKDAAWEAKLEKLLRKV